MNGRLSHSVSILDISVTYLIKSNNNQGKSESLKYGEAILNSKQQNGGERTKMNIQKSIVALLVMSLVIGSATISIAETEGAQLEFIDFCPTSLSYSEGEQLAFFVEIHNTGTEDVEDATCSYTVLDPNGTAVYDFDYSIDIPTGGSRVSVSRYLWTVPENATTGRYILEGVLRWDSEAIQKQTFFYVPNEPELTERELSMTSLYTTRLSYSPGDDIRCICRVKSNTTEDIAHYVSMAIFDQDGTMYQARASSEDVINSTGAHRHDFRCFSIPEDAERGIYKITAILWWEDKAVSKTTEFPVA